MRRPPLALALLLLLAPRLAADDVADWVRDLGDADGQRRHSAYLELVSRRPASAPQGLRRALPAHDDLGQYYGVLVLDTYPWKDVRRTWRHLLEEGTPFLRACAGGALALRGEEDAAAAWAAALTAEGVAVTPRLWMIGRVPTSPPPAVLEALRSLAEPGQDVQILVAVIQRMHERRDRAAMVRASQLLADPRPDARALAAAYLFRMGHADRAVDLAAAIQAGIGPLALPAVEEWLATTTRLPDALLEAATARLGGEADPWMRIRWIGFLQRFRAANARPLLQRLLHDADLQVARAAFDALVDLAGPMTGEALAPLLEDQDLDRRLWAAEALRRRDDARSLPVVLLVLSSGSAAQRTEAARVLGGFGREACMEALLDAMGDEHAGVRTEAGQSLAKTLGVLFPYRFFALDSTGWDANGAPETRAAAVEALRRWWEEHRLDDW